jgi:AcrR family transcriptional regulator
MNAPRRPYIRASEAVRREALIAAVLDLVAEGGLKAATVRATATRAGVTPGLIRHYFTTHDALVSAAYRTMMDRMLADNGAAIAIAPADPAVRLATCIVSWLRPPVMSPQTLRLWAGFLPMLGDEAALRDDHGYFCPILRDLIADVVRTLPGGTASRDTRALALACNAVIDGLWLEGCIQPDAWAPGALERIGLDACGAILGLDLKAPIPES